MSEQNESAPAARRNPLMWIALVVVGLILFVFLGGDRGGDRGGDSGVSDRVNTVADLQQEVQAALVEETAPVEETSDAIVVASIDDSLGESTSGTIERSLLVPPGMRARQYIEQLRAAGEPYPLSEVFDKAQVYQLEGSLADAHLLFFFAARENHLPAMMVMAEMSDPLRFDAADALLDSADVIQAYKWYRKAADLGQAQAATRLDELAAWAETAAVDGDTGARQLLLNIQ